jgi:hypothetical protein
LATRRHQRVALLTLLTLAVLALYDRRVALGSLAWLLLGSEPVLYLQVKALGGHAETLLLGAVLLAAGTATTFAAAAAARQGERQHRLLARALLQRGITRVYTDYWTCDRIAFRPGSRSCAPWSART